MKQKILDTLLNKRLSKTPEQDRRENASVASILKRFNDAEVVAESSDVEVTASSIIHPEVSRSEIDRPIIDRPKFNRAEIDQPSESGEKFLAVPNALIDHLLPKLPPTEQVVLLRLFRLSRGFWKDTCEVGQGPLQKACNITRNTLKTAVASLIQKGLIERLEVGSGPDGSVYRVNVGGAKFDRPEIDRADINRPEIDRANSGRAISDEPRSNFDNDRGAKTDPIKNMNSSIKTHTKTQSGVSVASRFTLEECRQYANHLKTTGQGITNPGGYATKIFRSGEADTLIEAFLNPPARLDPAQCPDCRGSNFVYLDTSNPDKGVKPCRHQKLG